MDPDQEVCLCFHVSRRKIERFLRLQQPQKAGQLSECFGAGTGCGWCRKYLVQMFQAAQSTANNPPSVDIPDQEQYAEMRRQYRESGRTSGPGDAESDFSK